MPSINLLYIRQHIIKQEMTTHNMMICTYYLSHSVHRTTKQR